MSTQAWYPFYWSDYSGKTMHLTMAQHGAFMMLLRWIYTTEKGIPAKQCYSIARAMTEQERSDVDAVLQEFFRIEGDFWVNGRASKVIDEQREKHQRRVNAGKKGGEAKAANSPSNATEKPEHSSTNQNQNQNQKDSQITKTSNVAARDSVGSSKDLKGVGKAAPEKPEFRVEHLLTDEDRVQAKELCKLLNRDFHHLCKVYDAWVNSAEDRPKKPGKAFLGWIPKYTKGERL